MWLELQAYAPEPPCDNRNCQDYKPSQSWCVLLPVLLLTPPPPPPPRRARRSFSFSFSFPVHSTPDLYAI